MIAIQKPLWRSLQEKEEGFTLVELIIVVVIIGILSAIAIPSFQNTSDKAKQKEASVLVASVLVASYLKALQAYVMEYGIPATRADQIEQYVSMTSCRALNPETCKKTSPLKPSGPQWFSPSGLYHMIIEHPARGVSGFTAIKAVPEGSYANQGYGVVGCLNLSNGSTRVKLMEGRGKRFVQVVSC